MNRKVFISGISGFIGSAIARQLASDGFAVAGLARQKQAAEDFEVILGDVTDLDRYADAVRNSQVVIHLAGPTTASEINSDPLNMMRITLEGTLNMLQAAGSREDLHFFYFSTGKVYATPEKLPIDEEHSLEPGTVLGKSKLAAERLVQYWASHSSGRYTIFRLFNAYGPGQKADFLIPTILRQCGSGSITLGDTSSKRDYIYIGDVVEALRRVIDSAAIRGRAEVFNLGSGKSYSAGDIVEEVGNIIGKRLSIEVDPARMRAGESAEERASMTRLIALGWESHYSLREGLARTIASMSNAAIS